MRPVGDEPRVKTADEGFIMRDAVAMGEPGLDSLFFFIL
jgi:hypothetical protein